MSRSQFLLIALATTGLTTTVTALRRDVPTVPRAGSVTPAAAMLEPRSGHTATLLPDGKVLIVGGMRRNQDFYRSAEVYDPATGKFQAAGQMTTARVGHIAELLPSGKILIAGGWVGNGSTDTAELYDPATRKFSNISKMSARRGRPSATLLSNGDVLIAGGADHTSPGGIASAEVFHASTMTFEPVGSMHHGRISHTATLLDDGRIVIAGGRGESLTPSIEIYDPKTKQFTEAGSLLTARYKHTAALLPDGQVLIAGGSDERDWHGAMNNAEVYNPRTGKSQAVSPLNESRFKLPDEAVQLSSGLVLISGGSTTVEIYDPKSEKFFVASGRMNDAWHFMTATRLKDGSVLLAGGYPNNDQATPQTWIYRP